MLFIVYGLAIIIIGFLIVFSFSNINVRVLILKSSQREEIIFTIKLLFGLVKYRIELPFIEALKKGYVINDLNFNSDIEMGQKEVIKDQKETDITFDELKTLYRRVKLIYKKYKRVLIYIYKRIIFDEITWETEVGTDDAALTAMATGTFWIIKTNFVTYVNRKFKLKVAGVNVVPCYEGERFNTSLNCIFSLKIGYIIIAALKLIYLKIKTGW